MARSLTFQLNGKDFVCLPDKVDRTKLYGFIDVEALDGKARKCQLATLADDGRTIVGVGGSAFGYLSPDGEWLDKSTLKPVDPEGRAITPVASTYGAPVPLDRTVSIDEFLTHNIKGVYQLRSDGDLAPIAAALKQGTIFSFPYSFRGGLEADAGFLIAGSDGTLFMCVGQPTSIHFVGLEQAAAPMEDDTESAEGDDDSVDFGMM